MADDCTYVSRVIAVTPGDKLVFADGRGRLQCCSDAGLRADALRRSLPPRYRILGTFPPGTSAEALRRALANA
jgi:hypothetical protein